MTSKAAALALLVSSLSSSPGSARDADLRAPEVERALQAIRPGALRAHMAFLADDLLEGRGTGTRGYDIAARYVAAQLEAAGLEPGTKAGWLQPVPLRRAELMAERSGMEIIAADGTRTAMALFDDVIIRPDMRGTTDVEAPLVFVGYGVTAPELGHDDYRSIDARGKIVAFFGDAPSSFKTTERAHYASTSEKARNAAAHGAVGMLRLSSPGEAQRFPWAMMVASSRNTGAFSWLADGKPFDFHPELRGGGAVSLSASERLFAGSKIEFEDAAEDKKPGPLAVRVRLFREGTVADVTSPNVVGLLRGSDPRLRDEYVVFTAHLDHLGIGTPVDGDSIYNGASDDASGCAALIELARAFAALPQRPRRSILFVAVTGEESGLLGSSYFANNPPVPIESLVANLNIDGMTLYPTESLVGRGVEHSTLARSLSAAASRVGLPLAPDPMPEQSFFVRSDQYSFIKRGVPALFLGTVMTERGLELARAYMHERYHRPSDDMTQPMDLEAGAQFARVYFLVGYHVAQDDERPRWNKGDFFGNRFGSAATRGR